MRLHELGPKGFGRAALGRLRSGLKSADSLFSKFKGQEERQQQQQVRPMDPIAPRPSTAFSTRSTAKSVRFSDETLADAVPTTKNTLRRLLSKKKLAGTDHWLYTRAYLIEKAAADREGRPCRLPPADAKWKWTEGEAEGDNDGDDGQEERPMDFEIRPTVPRQLEPWQINLMADTTTSAGTSNAELQQLPPPPQPPPLPHSPVAAAGEVKVTTAMPETDELQQYHQELHQQQAVQQGCVMHWDD